MMRRSWIRAGSGGGVDGAECAQAVARSTALARTSDDGRVAMYRSIRARVWVSLTDSTLRVEPPDVPHKLRKFRLCELVSATIQDSHNGLRQSAPVPLEVLDRHLGVIAAVIQVDGGYITQPGPKVRRQRELWE